ncbi:MAG: UDP-N-acetylglucosamine--N-acetylmuramyl-(pentapeptide) pyrophosphoryl-undecaprenol N-acetylglucosamine transferase [Lentisphaeria bacterium]|nr:UDP-N-acetylglucosamine--N-acetylmuramyl-(pentapeptide) pyrophosphoryl-undecaprenol N-acetylglucosamine transferase [Lentisphaeria bacterium]
MKSLHRLCISCGGTGGHFYPGLAVAEEWKKQGGEVRLLIGGKHAVKQHKIASDAGIEAVIVAAKPLSRNPLGLCKFAWAAWRGMGQCLKVFSQFHPDALLTMGSYAGFPPYLAARVRKVPLFLHDGNARLGKATLKMSRNAAALALSFPSPDTEKCRCPAVLTGMPLRPELLAGKTGKKTAIAEINQRWQLHFTADRFTVLVFGGSLGAAGINGQCRIPPDFPPDKIQLIHLTGPGKLEEVKNYYRNAAFPCLLLEGSPDIHLFYSAADWIVCRAGGSTVSEAAYFGKYALLIPYPFATQDHQTLNAKYLEPAGGVEIVQEHDLNQKYFLDCLTRMLADPQSYQQKGIRLCERAFPDASQRILNLIDRRLTELKTIDKADD